MRRITYACYDSYWEHYHRVKCMVAALKYKMHVSISPVASKMLCCVQCKGVRKRKMRKWLP